MALSSHEHTLVDLTAQHLQQEIDAAISSLIKADAERHDLYKGRILGLRDALKTLKHNAKKFALGDLDEEEAA